MTKKNQSKKQGNGKKRAKVAEQELNDEALDNVSGGTFLRGTIVQGETAEASLPGVQGSTQLAAKSSTTLECWESCTVYISGC